MILKNARAQFVQKYDDFHASDAWIDETTDERERFFGMSVVRVYPEMEMNDVEVNESVWRM